MEMHVVAQPSKRGEILRQRRRRPGLAADSDKKSKLEHAKEVMRVLSPGLGAAIGRMLAGG